MLCSYYWIPGSSDGQDIVDKTKQRHVQDVKYANIALCGGGRWVGKGLQWSCLLSSLAAAETSFPGKRMGGWEEADWPSSASEESEDVVGLSSWWWWSSDMCTPKNFTLLTISHHIHWCAVRCGPLSSSWSIWSPPNFFFCIFVTLKYFKSSNTRAWLLPDLSNQEITHTEHLWQSEVDLKKQCIIPQSKETDE